MSHDRSQANEWKPRILVVEDGPAEREALARVLRFEGYDVAMARDAATGLRHVSEPIDLVISDLRMGQQTGTGKELIARAIHQHSRRAAAPLVTVHMAAVPESLVESELFGHVQGPLAGAATERIGRLEAAEGGTLFIDEVGDFPHHCQAAL